jgi:hypothetical protein
MWSTPLASLADQGQRGQQRRAHLPREVLWPTATASDAGSSGAHGYPTEHRHSGTTLTDAAVRLFPTPCAIRSGSSNNGCPGDGRAEYATKGQPTLEALYASSERSLNPAWVEALMGFPVGWTDVGPPAEAKSKRPGNRPARSRVATKPASSGSTGRAGRGSEASGTPSSPRARKKPRSS